MGPSPKVDRVLTSPPTSSFTVALGLTVGAREHHQFDQAEVLGTDL